MIKKNLKVLLITSVVMLLPALAGIWLWKQLPDQLPIHWNMGGEVDGQASKLFVVAALPLILLALHWLSVFLTLNDPKRKNHVGKILNLIFWIVPVITVVLYTMIYLGALGRNARVEIIAPVLAGLIVVMIGNYLPKCKQNYTVGIKLSWTLHSEENWNRTHRLAGWLWVICGILVMVLGAVGLIWAMLPVLLVMTLVPVIYSYILYRRGI